jgi:dipeptidase
MRLTEEERNMREGLRSQTQRRAVAFMNEVEVERQAAAARGDKETAFWLQAQIKALADASTSADYTMVDNFEKAWQQRKESQQSAADVALAAKAPLPNALEILTRAHQKKAQEQREMQQRLTAHLKR